MKTIILLVLVLFAPALHAEPLNYDYLYFSSNDTESDSGQDTGGEAFGGFWEFADTLHLFGSYDDAGSYTGTGANPLWQYDTRTLRAGIGGHYLLGTRVMLAPSIAVLHARREINASDWNGLRKYTDTGYGMQLDLRYAVANWLELTAGSRTSRIFGENETDLVGGIIFHPTHWLALGAIYHDSDSQSGAELTVRWYY